MRTFPLGPLLVLFGLVGTAALVARYDYDTQGYLVVMFGLIAFSIWLFPKLAKSEGPWFVKFLVIAIFIKAGASMFRWWWGWHFKNGIADATGYHGTASRLYSEVRHLDFSNAWAYAETGTNFMKFFTTMVYSVIGPTVFGGYLFFGFLSFIGAIFYYKAFATAFPNGNKKLFALLILFYPSWVYWPSGIGKDSYMALMAAMLAYGAALLIAKGQLRGLLLLALGIAGSFMIRPHITAFFSVALVVPLVLRPPAFEGAAAPIKRAVLFGGGIVLVVAMLTQAASFLKLESFSLTDTQVLYDDLQRRGTDDGGSVYDPPYLFSPFGVPSAAITMLFRPFPWEAQSLQVFVLSLESIFLAFMLMRRWRSVRYGFTSFISDRYVLMMLIYLLIGIVAMSSLGNFSVLGRQRLQFMPYVLMLLALPTHKEAVAPSPKKKRVQRVRPRLPAPGLSPGLAARNTRIKEAGGAPQTAGT